jgi:hypothetical protein
MKKIILFIFIATWALLFGVQAETITGNCGDKGNNVILSVILSLNTEDSTLTISGTGAIRNYSGFFKLPWYSYPIQTVVIEEGVTSIGRYAYYCSGLTGVTIGNGVTNIRDRAFSDCSDLTNVTIGEGVKSIGEWAFTIAPA